MTRYAYHYHAVGSFGTTEKNKDGVVCVDAPILSAEAFDRVKADIAKAESYSDLRITSLSLLGSSD